jgi:hypothetical protein
MLWFLQCGNQSCPVNILFYQLLLSSNAFVLKLLNNFIVLNPQKLITTTTGMTSKYRIAMQTISGQFKETSLVTLILSIFNIFPFYTLF